MRKKQNSLLDKLNLENQTNHSIKSILDDIKPFLSKISEDTILTKKINLINNLISQNNLESSNKIHSILSEKFHYKYPFAFRINGWNLSHSDVTKNADLKTHIRIESSLNQIESLFYST